MTGAPTIPAGTPIGPYTVGRVLGQGASAIVYMAQDASGRSFAVKVRKSGDRYQDRRFLREFESMRLLRIGGVVPVHEAGIEGRWLWFSMDPVRGRGFLDALHEEDYLIDRVSQTIDRGIQLLSTLAELHGAGFVHRDIKPSNVLVDHGGRVHVLDFGIGRYFDDTSTLSDTGEVIGTVPYMAPEQLASVPLDGRVDLFATGLMIYEAIAGKRERPFTTVGWIPKICMERLPALATLFPEVPLGLSHLVDRLLAVDPRSRPSADEAVAMLRAIQDGSRIEEWPEGSFIDPGPWMRKLEGCIETDGLPIAILDGPSGSGRRRATEQVHRQALLQGRWTLHLHCRPDVIGAPLVELLEILIHFLDDQDLATLLGREARVIRQLWPHLLLPMAPEEDSRTADEGVEQAFAEIVGRLHETRSTLLVFHDVQYIDSFSERTVQRIAAHAGTTLGLIFIHEPRWKTARSSALLHNLRSTGSAQRIPVPPLSGPTASSLVDAICPEAGREFIGSVRPIEAMEAGWRALSQRRADTLHEVHPSLWPLAVGEHPLPAPVYRSLVGAEAEFGPWARRTRHGITLNGQTARAIVRSRLTHLARSADRIARSWSKSLGDRGNQGTLAYIWLLSSSYKLAWQPAAIAAVEADRRGLYGDARKWTLLLDAMPTPSNQSQEVAFELACVRARVALRTTAVSDRDDLLGQAEALAKTPSQHQRIATLYAEFDLRDGVVKPALVHALRIGSQEGGRTAIRARFIAIHCRLSLQQLADAQRELQRARAILAENSFPILEIQAENWAAEIAYRAHDLKRCRSHCLRAIEQSDAQDYVRGRAFATARLGRIHRQLGNRREAEREMTAAREAFARTGDVYLDASTGLALATLLAERGEILGARHLLDQAIRQSRSLHLNDSLHTAMRLTLQLATARLDQSEASMALQALTELPSTDSETPSVVARWWRVRGDFDRALSVEAPPSETYGHTAWRLERARSALASGDRDLAGREAHLAMKQAHAGSLSELATYAGLIVGLVDGANARSWNDLIRKATNSVWTEVYLAALELDARRQSDLEDPEAAQRKWHTLRARAAELGYQPAVEEAEGWLT